MSTPTLFLIALGVSADAFAVSLGKGLTTARLRWRDALLLAATFGLFQAAMPLLGWLLGTGLSGYVTGVDHWIAFGLLSLIGISMIRQALRGDSEDAGRAGGRLPLGELLVLGLATSVDALAVGVSFAFLDVDILGAVLAIGVTTFALSLVGVHVGHRAGVRFRGPAEVVGGLVLIAIGTRILVDHLGIW